MSVYPLIVTLSFSASFNDGPDKCEHNFAAARKAARQALLMSICGAAEEVLPVPRCCVRRNTLVPNGSSVLHHAE